MQGKLIGIGVMPSTPKLVLRHCLVLIEKPRGELQILERKEPMTEMSLDVRNYSIKHIGPSIK